MSGVDPETADSAVEQVLSAYKDCDKPLKKTAFYTKVGYQICGVGYYKD
jgi:hypothetical protein